MTTHTPIFPALAIGSLFLCSATWGQQAPAAPAATQPAEQRRPQNAQNPAITAPPAATEESLAKLEAGLPKLRAKLKSEFENGAEWKAAVEAVKKTAKDYEAARRTVLSRVRATPEYMKAASEHQKARQEYEALTDRPADEKTTERLLQQVLTARSAMTKLESAALQADPEVSAAKQASVKAQSDLAALRKRFEENYQSDPAWINQTNQIEAAQKSLADAQRRGEQERARQQQAALYYARREQEDRAFRREMMINMTVQRVMLEQQNQVLNQWYAAGPVWHGSRCAPRRPQYSYVPVVVYADRPSSGMPSGQPGDGAGAEPPPAPPSPPAPPPGY